MWSRYVALGDSFTEGLMDHLGPDGRHRGWADRFACALAVVNRSGSIAGTEVALAGSELVPDASAVAHVDPQNDGVRIVLEVTGLPPAPPGSFYAAWVVKEEPRTRIPIGTFHLRGGGNDRIELWAGVSTDDYPIVSVTRQSEADPAGPGEPMLRGRLGA